MGRRFMIVVCRVVNVCELRWSDVIESLSGVRECQAMEASALFLGRLGGSLTSSSPLAGYDRQWKCRNHGLIS